MEENSESPSATVDVNITSTPTFNVVANMEGPDRQYLDYIEKRSNCKISIIDTTGIYNTENEAPIKVNIVADNEESINRYYQNSIHNSKLQNNK